MLQGVPPALMPSHPKGDRGQSPPTSSPFHGCPGELLKPPWHEGGDIKSMGIATSPGTPEVWPYDPISHICANSPSVVWGVKSRPKHIPTHPPCCCPPHLFQLARDRYKLGGRSPKVITWCLVITEII